MVLERSVIRWLYGRPLETLLATWGISLILIQAVRTIFGAQNVQVENPSFMSGGVEIIDQRGAAVEPHRDHRCSPALVLLAHVAAAHAHAAGPLRARASRRTARWRLRRRAHRARRHAGVRPRLGPRGPRRLRALADRQRRTRPRPGLHRRLVHGRGARRRRPARRHGVRGARASASSTSCSSRGRARCSRRSWCSSSSSSSSRSARRACSR